MKMITPFPIGNTAKNAETALKIASDQSKSVGLRRIAWATLKAARGQDCNFEVLRAQFDRKRPIQSGATG